MKRNLLTKTLLLATGLLVGASAWAQTTTTLFERGIDEWTSADADAWSIASGNANNRVSISATSGTGLAFESLGENKSGGYTPDTYTAQRALSPSADNSILELTANWMVGAPNGRSGSTNHFLIFGDIEVRYYGQDQGWTIKVGSSEQTSRVSLSRNSVLAVKLTVNQATKVVAYTIGSTTGTGTTAASYSGDAVLKMGLGGSQSSWTCTSTLKTLKITEEAIAAGQHNYTIRGKAGEEILDVIATGTAEESADYEITGIPQVLSKAGTYYVLSDGDVTDHAKTFTMGTEDQELYVNYVADAAIVGYAEGESATKYEDGNSYSGGSTGYVESQNALNRGLSFANLPAGVYQFTARIYFGDRFRDIVLRPSYDTSTILASIVGTNSAEIGKEKTSGSFILPTSTTLWLNGSTQAANAGRTNRSGYFDYVIIRKTADLPTTVTIADNGVGYATFSSDYNLDFEGSDVTAYVATEAAAGNVKFEQVSTVPAKTGLFLKGNGTVNVTTVAVAAPAKNFLKPTTGATVAASNKDDNGIYHYVFAKQGEDLGFYNLGSDLTMTAGKAYLETSMSLAPAGARVAFVFGDETTGIADAVRSMEADGSCYNLNGQRVAQPAKGLYIVNGKKFINK